MFKKIIPAILMVSILITSGCIQQDNLQNNLVNQLDTWNLAVNSVNHKDHACFASSVPYGEFWEPQTSIGEGMSVMQCLNLCEDLSADFDGVCVGLIFREVVG